MAAGSAADWAEGYEVTVYEEAGYGEADYAEGGEWEVAEGGMPLLSSPYSAQRARTIRADSQGGQRPAPSGQQAVGAGPVGMGQGTAGSRHRRSSLSAPVPRRQSAVAAPLPRTLPDSRTVSKKARTSLPVSHTPSSGKSPGIASRKARESPGLESGRKNVVKSPGPPRSSLPVPTPPRATRALPLGPRTSPNGKTTSPSKPYSPGLSPGPELSPGVHSHPPGPRALPFSNCHALPGKMIKARENWLALGAAHRLQIC
ncbi:hypothetical protein T492DRAFT_831338 [Pavlovales sp. CCMP2436]|nr:hypothetical protein T492DRAFT_831338 [Pavlovales sp. CCMP2436]